MPTGQKNKFNLKKGNNLRLKIESLIFGGEGLARYKGMVIFIPFTTPGDEVDVEIEEVKKNFARARLMNIIKPSVHRISPLCPNFFNFQALTSCSKENLPSETDRIYCGGCVWQHIDYATQLKQKTYLVKEAIAYIGKLKDVVVHDIIGAKNEFSYRNKVQEAVGTKIVENKKELICGFYAPESHRLLDIKSCYLQPTVANEIIYFTKDIFNEYGLTAYDEEFNRGIIRHLIIRQSLRTREAMLIIVTRDKNLPNTPELIQKLTSNFPQIKSIIQNINNKKTNRILGDYSKLLFGKETISEKIGHLNFKISPTSFFQVNTHQAEVLYKTIEKFLNKSYQSQTSIIIDVFCGTGAIALWASQFSEKVYGIEVNESAIKDAIANTELNNITNCEFRLGEAELVLRRMYKQGLKPNTVIVDPPRKGCGRPVLDAIKNLNPENIIYVSCEPTTLARDLHYLDKLKYKTIEIQPIDMFPQTSHIECVVRLKRNIYRTDTMTQRKSNN